MSHTFLSDSSRGRTPHTSFRRHSRGGDCRLPFIGPLKGACPSLCPQKARRHSFYVYGKIKYMISQKSYIENPHGGGVV